MGRFEDFLATRRSVETAKIYRRCVLQFTKDPDAFLELAEKDRGAAEKAIIDYFVAAKTAGATRRGKYHAIKSFLTFYDVETQVEEDLLDPAGRQEGRPGQGPH